MPNDHAGVVIPLDRRPLTRTQATERQQALARALAMEVELDAPPLRLDEAQPRVQALLSKMASCPGVRHASLWTCTGEKVASVARLEDDPADLGVLMGALRAVAELAVETLEGTPVEMVITHAGGLRMETRVLESRFLLILAVEKDVPPERVQFTVSSVLCALHGALHTR